MHSGVVLGRGCVECKLVGHVSQAVLRPDGWMGWSKMMVSALPAVNISPQTETTAPAVNTVCTHSLSLGVVCVSTCSIQPCCMLFLL